MADFCEQCSEEMFGQDCRDLAGLRTEEHKAGNLYPTVLCEGCGMTQVDEEGRCVAPDHLDADGSHKSMHDIP